MSSLKIGDPISAIESVDLEVKPRVLSARPVRSTSVPQRYIQINLWPNPLFQYEPLSFTSATESLLMNDCIVLGSAQVDQLSDAPTTTLQKKRFGHGQPAYMIQDLFGTVRLAMEARNTKRMQSGQYWNTL